MPRPTAPPRVLGSAWLPRRQTRRGTASLSREAIIKAAIDIIDRDGLAGLTMRTLAAELEVGPTTVYWHVTDKEELLDLVIDEVLGEVELPESGDWKAILRSTYASLRETVLRHRDMSHLLASRVHVGPHALRLREHIAATLVTAGVPLTMLAAVDRALVGFTIGSASAEAAGAEPGFADRAQQDEAATAFIRALPAEEYPSLLVMAKESSTQSRDDAFRFGLDALLDGVEAASGPRGAKTRTRRGRST